MNKELESLYAYHQYLYKILGIAPPSLYDIGERLKKAINGEVSEKLTDYIIKTSPIGLDNIYNTWKDTSVAYAGVQIISYQQFKRELALQKFF